MSSMRYWVANSFDQEELILELVILRNNLFYYYDINSKINYSKLNNQNIYQSFISSLFFIL